METRRSRRLQFQENSINENDTDSPAPKKWKTTNTESVESSSKAVKTPRSKPIKSAYFDDKNDCEICNIPVKRRAQKTKSSYFESPVESDVESEYKLDDSEPEPPVKTRGKAMKKLKQTWESEYDSSSEEFTNSKRITPKTPNKSEPNYHSKARSKITQRPKPMFRSESGSDSEESGKRKIVLHKMASSLNNRSSLSSTQKMKNSYESESDTSSDEFVKAPESLLDLPKSEMVGSNLADANDFDIDLDAADTKPPEYFDFASLVSQVTEATKTSEEVVKPEVKKENTAKVTPEKKPKRGGSKRALKKVDSFADPVKSEPLEVCELLAMGEDTDLSAKDIKETVANSSQNYEIPNQVEVLLDAPVAMKKKRCNDLEIALRRRLNNIKREHQVYVHKVHVLCYVAHGNHLNSILNSSDVLSVALSLLPSEKCYPPKRMNMEYLEDLLNWFGKKVKLKKDQATKEPNDLSESLQTQLQKLEAQSKTHFCFMFLCLLRALGIRCRLVINLNVAPIKPTSDQLLPVNQKPDRDKLASSSAKPVSCSPEKERTPVKSSGKNKSDEKSKKSASSSREMGKKASTSFVSKSDAKKKNFHFKEEIKPTRKSGRQTQSTSKYFEEMVEEDEKSKPKSSRSKSKLKKKVVEESLVEEMSSTDESDFEDFVSPKKKKIDRRVLSSEDDKDLKTGKDAKADNKAKQENKTNYWIEVYLEAEEKWFCVDVVKKSYHCIKQLYINASHPVRYILAWHNDQSIKDVTRRYVPQYLSVTRKLRVDDNWWKCTMKPYEPPRTPQNKEEDEELDKILEELPVPASISECKNHPLYALKRHLLKFQAIYPPDAIPVGYIKGEPVYSRLCVQQLHGREMWIKEAKVVKLNETPYKIVKGRPQKTKFGTSEPPKDLELFGSWQVEDYVPPTAENGKVPRNAFGNVELFKPSMLPKGTVYLQLPGLQRIANKLSIDCAAAITGFEYSTNGWSYPVKDGFVVCEEFKDILLDAYNQEVEEAEKKEKQKREERVYANWKRLIKGLFIRERLKRKYNFGDPVASTSKTDA